MAGLDEASARSVLAVMQERLARDPMSALGLSPNASAVDLRTAFLELTKRYHPVRFGRMAPEIQKLSNEVFLALRAAHDALAKTLRRQSGPIAIARAPSSSPLPVLPAAAAQAPAQPGARGTPPAVPRPLRPPGAQDSAERAPVAIPVSPSAGTRPVPRPAAPRPSGSPHPPSPSGPVRSMTAQLATPRDESAVLDLLSRQQWDQARTALHQLLAREPGSKRILALSCYARGREAQLDGRVDDARVELQDALEHDPDLQVAKTALTELFTRRK